MAYMELHMIDVREILRRQRLGHGARRIAAAVGIDRKTAGRYVDAAHEAERLTLAEQQGMPFEDMPLLVAQDEGEGAQGVGGARRRAPRRPRPARDLSRRCRFARQERRSA